MKTGDLVSPVNSCGGNPGEAKCETALVLDIWLSHTEAYQTDSQEYRDKDVYECSLACKCGIFEEYTDRLDVIHEAG